MYKEKFHNLQKEVFIKNLKKICSNKYNIILQKMIIVKVYNSWINLIYFGTLKNKAINTFNKIKKITQIYKINITKIVY